ncbi:MAG: hypothetical protein Q9159_002056 [Coniocarpon cinnabarinum]
MELCIHTALSNNSISDFLILEYNDVIRGRVAHTNFGSDPDGKPYVVELGANWAKRYNVTNTYSNYSDILTYNETGFTDYAYLFDEYEDAYSIVEQDAGTILSENLLDQNAATAFTLAGWQPRRNMARQAVDWWQWDWEWAFPPTETSQVFGIVNYNTTFYQYSDANNYVFDQRGYNTFICGLASEYLAPNDPRLLLNTIVTNITHAPDSVTVTTSDSRCFRARHAICTFSLGVLQAAHAGDAPVSFDPVFPSWKQSAIASFGMGIYTKIFLQFEPSEQFWDQNTQFFLYASPTTRGYYPVWQSLAAPGFLENSGILFVTVVDAESRRVEAQDDATTLSEVLEVLRQMFGAQVPQPKAFMYPRWGQMPWAYGSYSNWPTGVTLRQHQNLRANVGALWFAGEHTHPEYYGFLQGAYFEGQRVAESVAACLNGTSGDDCPGELHYPVLHGTTDASLYSAANGWEISSFQTIGDE